MANWKGTTVPNSGTVEKVYFNTNLTVEEVYNLVNSIDYDFSTMVNYYILADENFDVQLLISTTDPSKSFVIHGGIGEEDVTIFSYNFLEEFEGGDGWQTFNNPLTVNTTAISEFEEEGERMTFGTENSKLSSLFSITPFEEEVTLEGFLTDCCDAVREKEGTADKILALDIPSRIRALSSGGSASETLLELRFNIEGTNLNVNNVGVLNNPDNVPIYKASVNTSDFIFSELEVYSGDITLSKVTTTIQAGLIDKGYITAMTVDDMDNMTYYFVKLQDLEGKTIPYLSGVEITRNDTTKEGMFFQINLDGISKMGNFYAVIPGSTSSPLLNDSYPTRTIDNLQLSIPQELYIIER